MKKIVALVDNLFEDLELMYPLIRMKEEGFEVITAGEKKDYIYTGKNGYPQKADQSYTDIQNVNFDGVLIPGGFAPDKFRRNSILLEIIQKVHKENKIIAFICHGGWLPISAKILKGKKVTGTIAIKDDLENAGAIWLDQEVVVDGNLISSRTPKDLHHFGKAIISALK